MKNHPESDENNQIVFMIHPVIRSKIYSLLRIKMGLGGVLLNRVKNVLKEGGGGCVTM